MITFDTDTLNAWITGFFALAAVSFVLAVTVLVRLQRLSRPAGVPSSTPTRVAEVARVRTTEPAFGERAA